MMQRSQRRGWHWSRASSRFWHPGSPFSASTPRPRCDKSRAKCRSHGTCEGISGRGQFVCHGTSSSVRVGWRHSRRGRIITMADRYQGRPFPADDDYDRGADPHASARAESDPLAELARLIGQTDPFARPWAGPIRPCSRGAASAISTSDRLRRKRIFPRQARRRGCSALPGRTAAATASPAAARLSKPG